VLSSRHLSPSPPDQDVWRQRGVLAPGSPLLLLHVYELRKKLYPVYQCFHHSLQVYKQHPSPTFLLRTVVPVTVGGAGFPRSLGRGPRAGAALQNIYIYSI
uniref:Uncharacterized protein n=1 Tax=Scleropages formosus TaxID=113540 RepID=A0A8C9UXP5_SCLFO